jgi:putative NADH-flavin reductase
VRRILVIGATGGIGRKVCELGLARGFDVVALARRPEKLTSLGPALRVLSGDPLDPRALSEAAQDRDAVISALGAPGRGPTTVHADGATALVVALARLANPPRALMVSAAMLFEDAGWFAALLRTVVLRNVAEDSRLAERILAEGAKTWTIIRPPRLTNGARTERWQVAEGRLPPGARASISRADVASCLLALAQRADSACRLLGVALTGQEAPATTKE